MERVLRYDQNYFGWFEEKKEFAGSANKLSRLIDIMEKKWSKEEQESAPIVRSSEVAKIVKPVKVPTWNKSMSLEVYTRKLTI